MIEIAAKEDISKRSRPHFGKHGPDPVFVNKLNIPEVHMFSEETEEILLEKINGAVDILDPKNIYIDKNKETWSGNPGHPKFSVEGFEISED